MLMPEGWPAGRDGHCLNYMIDEVRSLRADVSYFLASRGNPISEWSKEIGDVCTQAMKSVDKYGIRA